MPQYYSGEGVGLLSSLWLCSVASIDRMSSERHTIGFFTYKYDVLFQTTRVSSQSDIEWYQTQLSWACESLNSWIQHVVLHYFGVSEYKIIISPLWHPNWQTPRREQLRISVLSSQCWRNLSGGISIPCCFKKTSRFLGDIAERVMAPWVNKCKSEFPLFYSLVHPIHDGWAKHELRDWYYRAQSQNYSTHTLLHYCPQRNHAGGAKSKSKLKERKETKTKEFQYTFKNTKENYISFLTTILVKNGEEKYNVTEKMTYGIKVQLPGVKYSPRSHYRPDFWPCLKERRHCWHWYLRWIPRSCCWHSWWIATKDECLCQHGGHREVLEQG
jgi:hypothetical protein